MISRKLAHKVLNELQAIMGYIELKEQRKAMDKIRELSWMIRQSTEKKKPKG
jgi:sensor histidine kinase regulating citrate/malate metabolism